MAKCSGAPMCSRFMVTSGSLFVIFFFQAEDGIRDGHVTGVQTCALPIYPFTFDLHTVQLLNSNVKGWTIRDFCESYARSEERRVGKECRSRGSPDHLKKKKQGEKEKNIYVEYITVLTVRLRHGLVDNISA